MAEGYGFKRDLSTAFDPYAANSKKQRTESYGSSGSQVLHVRNVSPETSHEELVTFCSQFGAVVAVCFLAKYQQALVEMDSPAAAGSIVMYSKSTPVFIRGKEVHFEFSKSQHINTSQASRPNQNPGGINHILLCTIQNPMYNITVDVIHAIMSPYGNVNKIVVFSKNAVQALVEFDNAYSASQAMGALDGKDIYAGSCTLKIEFSKAEKLNIHVNNDKSRDYNNPTLPTTPSTPQAPAQPAGGQYGYNPYAAQGYGYPPQQQMQPVNPLAGGIPGCVCLAYNLDEQLTLDRIFNLFCQYGNVVKVKILTNKKGSGMIQMESADQVERAVQSLNGLTIFGQQLSLQVSKHGYIAESHFDRDAASTNATNPSTKDYTGSTHNRFKGGAAQKHGPYRPSATLYFTNVPKDQTEQSITDYFAAEGTHVPIAVKFFTPMTPSSNSELNERKIGLAEFESTSMASEALAIANNGRIGGNTMKLSFTTNTISSVTSNQQAAQLQQATGDGSEQYTA